MDIEIFLSKITGISVKITPAIMILGIGQDLDTRTPMYTHRYLIVIAMTVARLCIATDWLQPEPPTFEHWHAKMYSLFSLEQTLYAVKGARKWKIGICIWGAFYDYMNA